MLLPRLCNILWRQPDQQIHRSVLNGKLEPDYSFGAGQDRRYPRLGWVIDTARGFAKCKIGDNVECNKIKPSGHIERSVLALLLQLLDEIVRVILEVALLLASTWPKMSVRMQVLNKVGMVVTLTVLSG